MNTSSDTKIYHVEGEPSAVTISMSAVVVLAVYARVKMKEVEGDLWFCTKAEAEANGFRAPGQ